MSENVSILIPAYNEAGAIGQIVTEIKARFPDAELIVIDDGSTDDTAATAARCGATVYRHPYNIGNGAAVKTGIRKATGDILVMMDGDGQHPPEKIASLVDSLADYDMAVGARTATEHASWRRSAGNYFLNMLASYVAKFKVKDLTSGFRAIRTELARSFLYLLPNTYSYPTTMTLGVLRSGRSVIYQPVPARKRKKGKSNVHLVKDGVRFFMIILKICTLYSPLRIFLPLSGVIALSGMGYYLYTFLRWGRFTNMSALMFTTATLVFLMGLISEQICQMRYEKSEMDEDK